MTVTRRNTHVVSSPAPQTSHADATSPPPPYQVVFALCRGKQRQQGSKLDVAATTAGILAERRGEGPAPHDCIPIRVNEEGLVFELNNRLQHYVANGGSTPRIHMVVDVAEHAQQVTQLAAGQPCVYNHGHITCS